jgi:hypothetical protein
VRIVWYIGYYGGKIGCFGGLHTKIVAINSGYMTNYHYLCRQILGENRYA